MIMLIPIPKLYTTHDHHAREHRIQFIKYSKTHKVFYTPSSDNLLLSPSFMLALHVAVL